MRQLILILAGIALLAGCASAPRMAPGLRDRDALISSAALFDPTRFAGDWHVVASGQPGCKGVQSWRWDGSGSFDVRGAECAGATGPLDAKVVLTGPGGRMSAREAFGGEPIYVMWVDQDYRIAALGTPSGQWGMILSRQTPARPDLLKAAREVLDFNGYDLRKISP
ncbi:lipocalin [Thioclava dalianensis]|uniref:Lipocalin n=1 Tax=Thioclava dalianensis TaxID=1185766 RepID=A0A074TLF2_9RHOB|nr:lipocalin family protein [Thioclava dalianensis]KEP69808.1 lipocalin [Thioclava dalianensis]SFM86261.1 apolipoprotein D and lipocalin family protein [Thioclava dalianensis]